MPVAVTRAALTLPTAVLCAQLLIAASSWPRPAEGARILAVQTVAGKSHWNFMKGVLRAMVDYGGHRVTVYTPFADATATPVHGDGGHYVEVDTSGDYGEQNLVTDLNASLAVSLFSRPSFLVPFMANVSHAVCDMMDGWLADHHNGSGDAFDLFVVEPMPYECASRAVHRLGVPVVYVVPSPLLPWMDTAMFGHLANPAHAPHLMSPYAVLDTFYRRAYNVWLYVYTAYLHYRYVFGTAAAENRLFDRTLPVKPSMVFVNTHFITEPSSPVTANRVDVGGIHLTEPKPLPADVLKFIDDSPHGVVYLTLGSVVVMSTLPDHIQKALIGALAELPQRVLMKYEGEMKDKPKNVMISKWLPQRDILLHPKVKLFIGHGGISGVYEAVDAGVPVLGFPVFYDQPRNIDNLVNAGMAISLDLMSVSKDQFLKAITDIINNKSYEQNAKIVSERFKDRPMPPTESVVYWTDYVIRHKGAPHLKSHALNLTWYQYFLLDVIAVALLIILLVVYVTFKVVGFIKKRILKLSLRPKLKSE